MRDLVARLEVRTPSLEQPVEFLSGGNQQKVSVSRTFLREPVVILAYEPTQGVDVGSRIRHLPRPSAADSTAAPPSWSSRATLSNSPGCATGFS